MTINGYPYVRRQQWRGSEHRGQRSLATNHRFAKEPASGAQGKPRGKDVINLVKNSRRKVGAS